MNARVLDGEIITSRLDDVRAYDGVRTRRILAFIIDYCIVALLTIPFAILVFFLALFGIVTPGWMWRNLRYYILVIFIIAAILTPTTDIMNMCVFAAPMIGLYVLSIGVAWLVHPTRRKARKGETV